MTTAPADPELNATAAARVAGRWAGALGEYRGYLTDGRGLASSTVGMRLRILGTFAETIGRAPWAVEPAAVVEWFAGRQLARESRRTYRHQLAAFYRWAAEVGHVNASPIVAPAGAVARQPAPAWAGALETWARAEGARGVSAGTMRTRGKLLRRFADECTVPSPWIVERPHVLAWLERFESGHSQGTARGALRAFYRWAITAGRIVDDPTDEPSRRYGTRRVAAPWEESLAQWRRHMIAEGKPTTTTDLRLTHLRRFAREHPHLGPLAATTGELVDWLASKRWAPETRRSVRSSLRAFYRWAKRSGQIAKNPAAKLPPVRSPIVTARPATDTDYRAALARAERSDRLALRLAAELGMRRGEVAQVHSSDIRHTEHGAALVVHGKGRRQRVLPLPATIAAELSTRPAGYVFPGQIDGHVSAAWLGKRLSAILPAGVTMHMLRHRFATAAYAVDRDVLTVQRLLGHASPATTQRYVDVTTDRMRQLVEAVAS